MTIRSLKVNRKGMITIPSDIREKYAIVEGSEVMVMEIEGQIQIVPIIPLERLRDQLPACDEMEKSYRESKKEQLELED